MKNFVKKYFPLLLINIISFVLICFPFWKGNTLKTLDLAGHVFATTFMRDYIFPNISGWNPFQNLGYPFGSQYPPLIQYIVAGISKISSIDIVSLYKIAIILVILLLPWAIYFLIQKLNNNKLSSFIVCAITIIVFLMTILLPSTFGGSLKATLSSGLLNNFLTMPILYLYLGYIVDFFNSKTNRSHILKLSLLLSVLILSHLVAGLVGALIGGVVILVKVIKRKEYTSLLIPLISLLLTGFFVIPYILNSRYLTASKPVISDLIYTLGILVLTIVTLGIVYFKTKGKIYLLLAFVTILLTSLPLFEAVTYRISGLTNFQLINAYRILPYAFFIGIPTLLLVVTKLVVIPKKLEILGIGLLFILSILVIYKSHLELGDTGSIDENKILTTTLPSNYIPIYSRDDIWDFTRTPYMNLNDIKNMNFSLLGQFEESSYLNHFVISLTKALDPSIKQTPVSKIVYIEDLKLNPNKIDLIKDLFNIGYGLTLNENDKSICDVVTPLQNINTRYNDLGSFGLRDDILSLCKLPVSTNTDVDIFSNTSQFESVSSGNWNSKVIDWWTEEDNNILVEDGAFGLASDNIPFESKLHSNIRLNWSNNFQKFDFNIPTVTDSWALVKEQYNPRWKAYDENNNEIKIYRVSPSLMMVDSHGKVTFKYEFSMWENILKLLSLFSFISILGYFVYKKLKIKKDE